MPRKPLDTEKQEARVMRISLVLTPTLNSQVRTLADALGTTVNDLVTGTLEKLVKKNSLVIEKFDKARRQAAKNFVDFDYEPADEPEQK